jgi:hypothetical protein
MHYGESIKPIPLPPLWIEEASKRISIAVKISSIETSFLSTVTFISGMKAPEKSGVKEWLKLYMILNNYILMPMRRFWDRFPTSREWKI